MTPSLQPLVSLNKAYKDSEQVFVKLSQSYEDGVTRKDMVPRFDGMHIENLFETELAFRDVAEDLEFTTGPELFSNFRKCLTGTARTKFRDAARGKPVTPEGFEEALVAWKRKYMSANARSVLIEYLQNLKKPDDMEVRVFYERLDVLVTYVSAIPSEADEEVTDHDVKRFFRDSMEEDWIQNFTRANTNLAATSMATLVQFMANEESFGSQEASTAKSPKKKRAKDTSSDDTPSDDNEKSKKRPKLKANDFCPIHGFHTWGKCELNDRSPNYTFKGYNQGHPHAEHGGWRNATAAHGQQHHPVSSGNRHPHRPPNGINANLCDPYSIQGDRNGSPQGYWGQLDSTNLQGWAQCLRR